jgi:hypothetical protein
LAYRFLYVQALRAQPNEAMAPVRIEPSEVPLGTALLGWIDHAGEMTAERPRESQPRM